MSSDQQLHAAGFKRYNFHTPGHGNSDWLDLTQFQPTSQPCQSLDKMTEEHGQHAIPIALLAMDSKYVASKEKRYIADGMLREEFAPLVRAALKHENSFHSTCPSYLKVTFSKWIQLAEQLPEADRNFAAIVLPGLPVHYYADLDGAFDWCLPVDSDKLEACKSEFESEFQVFFRSQFQRDADLGGLHWEQALGHARKLSLHLHVVSEAFATLEDLRRFDVAWRAYLCARPAEVLASSMLCRAEKECLIDGSVYSKNRVMRLGGNCKPHGPVLNSPDGLSLAQMMFRGLPNFSLPASAGYTWLTFGSADADDKSTAPSKKRQARMQIPACIETQDWERFLQPWLGPNVRLYPFQSSDFGRTIHSGTYVGTSWCCHLSTPGAPVSHKSNRVSVTFDTVTHMVTLRCFDDLCKFSPTYLERAPLLDDIDALLAEIDSQIKPDDPVQQAYELIAKHKPASTKSLPTVKARYVRKVTPRSYTRVVSSRKRR
jgi:hypothetical protein